MQPLDPILEDGYRARNRRLYRLDETHLEHQYVSDAMREEAKKINREVADVANDKARLAEALGPYGSFAVPTYGWIEDGEYVAYGFPNTEVKQVLADGAKVVAKPRWGSDGYGVRIFEQPEDFDTIMGLDGHVLTGYVRQARYAEAIWPHSTNTIRIFTMRLPGQNSFVAAAIHRFGTNRSGHTDNWEQGGMSVSISPGGRLGLGAITSGSGPVWFHRHPDTGHKFYGLLIPGWRDLVDLVLEMADYVSDLAHIGWDIVITADGPVVLEMNANCGVCAIQVHGGLLRFKAVRAFYAHHDIRLPDEARHS